MPLLESTAEGFGLVIIVLDSWYRGGSQHTQFHHKKSQGGDSHATVFLRIE